MGGKYIEKKFKKNIKHLIVDEFQDISKKRSEIIKNVEQNVNQNYSSLEMIGNP